MEQIFEHIKEEAKRQDEKWGEQNHPILDWGLVDRPAKRMCEEYEIPSEERAKQLCDINFKRDTGTWMHILVEEVSEAASCKDIYSLRNELVQVATVTTQMIKSLDKNGK